MNLQKLLSIAAPLLLLSISLQAETLYGPGTITVPTNQAIVINTIGSGVQLYVDGNRINADPVAYNVTNPRFALAGPHTITATDENGVDVFVTFQRIKGPVIKTVITSPGQTNTINVPAGKTIQFFDFLGRTEMTVTLQSTNSPAKYNLINRTYNQYSRPSATGPATIEISCTGGVAGTNVTAVTYYLVSRPKTATPMDLMY